MRKVLSVVPLIVCLIMMNFLRLYFYQQPQFSVSMLDTESYLNAANLPFTSWKFFTSKRAFSLPLIYQWLAAASGDRVTTLYQITNLSEPARDVDPARPRFQPGLDRVAVFQLILAMVAWNVLAISVYRHLNNSYVRIVAVLLILSFAFVPQVADWDRLAMSESASFSFFALFLAFTLELLFWLASGRAWPGWRVAVLILLWALSAVAWTFTRDVNSYLMAWMGVLGLMPWLFAKLRWRFRWQAAILLAIFSMGLFIFHQVTFRQSQRWLQPLLNNLTQNVFPYDSRVAFFRERGMPVSPELLEVRTSMEYSEITQHEEFMEWARTRGYAAYSEFLLRTPLWAVLTFVNQFDGLFAENRQSFFYAEPPLRPNWAIPLGDLLHPKSGATALIDLGLMIAILLLAVQRSNSSEWIMPWSWIFLWLVLGSVGLVFLGFHGEVRSVARHALAGVFALRLSVWLLLCTLCDGVLALRQSGGAF